MYKPSLAGFCFKYFHWAGKLTSKVLKSYMHRDIDSTLEAANIKIYPEAYLSIIGFFTFVTPALAAIGLILGATYLAPELTQFPLFLTWLSLILSMPFLILMLGYTVPKIMAFNRALSLDIEVPFASAYISVMATGGQSPFRSLRRLKDFPLLPNVSKAAKNIDLDVRILGYDPVTAIEKSARHLPSRDYKDLLLGYASTLRAGGDVIHYLLRRTETMFRDQAIRLKAVGERMSTLMEVYIAISVLAALSFYVIYATAMAFEQFFTTPFFSTGSFMLFAYILLPSISILFLYLADITQMSHPVSEWGPYKVYLATTPLMLFLTYCMLIPFAAPELSVPFITKPFVDFIILIRNLISLERGYEAAIGLSIVFIISAIPACVAHYLYTRRSGGVEFDITNFLRDLVESRKTGLSPEKCIETLSTRSYGKLTKYLVVVARQITWGFPIRTIYEAFSKRVKSWLALVNMYLLVDAIEVGGGAPETLETLAQFSEMVSSLEKEKRTMLRPLLIIPYIGAGILLFTNIVFLGYMRSVIRMFGRQAIPFPQFVTLLLPPMIIHTYLTGLVTGKMGSGSISAGFKHALLLTIVALFVVWLSPYFIMPISEAIHP